MTANDMCTPLPWQYRFVASCLALLLTACAAETGESRGVRLPGIALPVELLASARNGEAQVTSALKQVSRDEIRLRGEWKLPGGCYDFAPRAAVSRDTVVVLLSESIENIDARGGCTEAIVEYGYVLAVRDIPASSHTLLVRSVGGTVLWSGALKRSSSGKFDPGWIEIPDHRDIAY